MSSIQGSGDGSLPISRQDRKLYETEYKHGLDLFQRALSEHASADEIHKRAAFEEVMERSMQVLDETAKELKRNDLLEQNSKISADLQAYEKEGADSLKKALAADLDEAKKRIG